MRSYQAPGAGAGQGLDQQDREQQEEVEDREEEHVPGKLAVSARRLGIPGMGRTLINAINSKDFPVIQTFTALFAALFIASNILTDVLYALADPRVRLS